MKYYYTYLIHEYEKSNGEFHFTSLNGAVFATKEDASLDSDKDVVKLRDGSYYRDLDSNFEIFELKELYLWESINEDV